MSTYTPNSTNNRAGPEQFNRGRGNRRNNYHRQRGGHSRNSRDSSPQEQTSQSSRVIISPSNSNENPSPLSPNDSICSICAEPIQYFAVPECNHKLCHLCSLRLRVLYKKRMCAYCKTEQKKVIFTRNPDKNYQEFNELNYSYFNRKYSIYCEDEEMFGDIMLLLRFNCPESTCEVSCDGWVELKRHVRRVHRLMLCEICTRNKKIFAHEHSLFTPEKLDKHIHEGYEGDEVTGFKGHPECQFCERFFYGDDELYEHCRDQHEKCFICTRNGHGDIYFRNYNSLEEHFRLEHFLCENEECLEKKFVVFGSDIDLKAHELSAHGINFSGQRANRHEARRIETNFSFRDSYSRGRGRQRSRERQADGDGSIHTTVDDISRQTQNLNLDPIAFVVNDMVSNVRSVRPPPGFGVLSDEVIGSSDELPENEIAIRNVASTPARTREEEFPTLSDAMRVTTSNNNSGTIPNYSQKVKEKSKPPKPKHADKPAQSVASSSRSVSESNFLQQPLFESTNKRESPAFPPLPSANHSTSSSNSSSVLNYREKAISGNSNTSSRNFAFYQRVNQHLSNNSAKMDEFKSLTTMYTDSFLDASSYIESLLPLFNKNMGVVGKVVSSLVETLEDEKKKTELLSTWNDRKAKRTADFPALESIHSPPHNVVNNSKPNNTNKTNKSPARVLVIKSSTARSGGKKASSGPVWDKIAAIAENRIKEKNNSDFPSLVTSTAATTASNNNSWKGSIQQNESTSSSSNSPATTNISSYTTAFVRGRPTQAENNEFPVLPSTSKSSYSQQSSKNGGLERNAWGQGGAFTSVVSGNNHNENDSEDDSSHNESTKEGGKKKKQKKSKNILFHVGYKNAY